MFTGSGHAPYGVHDKLAGGIGGSNNMNMMLGGHIQSRLSANIREEKGFRYSHINAVTKADVLRAAKQYVDLDHLVIVIVGDRKAIEGPLQATGIAPIVILDDQGVRQQ